MLKTYATLFYNLQNYIDLLTTSAILFYILQTYIDLQRLINVVAVSWDFRGETLDDVRLPTNEVDNLSSILF